MESSPVTKEFPVKEIGGSVGVTFPKDERLSLDIQIGDVLVPYKLKEKGKDEQLWLKVEKRR